ncbi:hypothetical protein PoB_007153900 [Plakobranchus ocellatus]|uniref:Uncharacterized protein n=1 Tax=Plakobranchus ocellatus TaxID=259542 RepID=A0AAV4DLE4_9GAST|nr:hypothetical protein PoB_007153900 [Plakobranchus ocellatus]
MGFEAVTGRFLQISGRIRYDCATRPPGQGRGGWANVTMVIVTRNSSLTISLSLTVVSADSCQHLVYLTQKLQSLLVRCLKGKVVMSPFKVVTISSLGPL